MSHLFTRREQPHLSGPQLYDREIDRHLQNAVSAAETQRDAVRTNDDKRVSVAVITAGVTGVLAVLGASADGLETLAPSELDWVLTTAIVVLVAISLVLFVVFRVTHLSKQETKHLRTALDMVLDAANEHLKGSEALPVHPSQGTDPGPLPNRKS